MKKTFMLAMIFAFIGISNVKAQKSVIDGVWVGQGYQLNNNSTWSIILKIENGKYNIEYPSIKCKGSLTVSKVEANKIILDEFISTGNCENGGKVILEMNGQNELFFKWSFRGGEPGSYAKLIRF